MRRFIAIAALVIAVGIGAPSQAPPQQEVLGSHYLGPGGTSPVQGQSSAACMYCHAPHSGVGGSTPLWSQSLTAQNYTLYSSTTMQNIPTQPGISGRSLLCLSCHDGTVGVGSKVPYGTLTMTGSMHAKDVFGTDLGNSHPLSLKTPLTDAAHLASGLAASGTTTDPQQQVKLVNGTVECRSCHEPHMQGIDAVAMKFLVRDGVNGQLCLSCHTATARTVNGRENPLAQWAAGIHSTSGAQVASSAKLGNYATVAQFACQSCHRSHNATGNTLLQPAEPAAPWMDTSAQACMTCHNGANLLQPIANVFAEFAKTGHPFPTAAEQHTVTENILLANNRHATCADCHNAHAAQQTAAFNAAPALRPAQSGVAGVDANGATELPAAANQFENCLRCHGSSPGKQVLDKYGYLPLRAVSDADRLNLVPQFATTATSSHPVMHLPNSGRPQPSLRAFMLKLDGITDSPRSLSMATDRLFCTDCHNSDANREFGGSAPNGPHGSQYSHILERRYEFSQVAIAAGPGSLIQNLFPAPDLSAGGGSPGPYAMCGKCHDLATVMTAVSWPPASSGNGGHQTHVSGVGVSCSVCHTSHGMGAVSASISGERLVNFDVHVVAPNGATPISYSRASNSCTLSCHGMAHNADGSVTPARTPTARGIPMQ